MYWQTANLIVESGALDEEANDATNYGKTAVAIALAQKEGVNVSLPLINEAEFGFKPDIKNNRVIFGLKGINGINTETSQVIISNRPYTSMEDFAHKLIDTGIIKNNQMLQLIKGGCFTELHSSDKTETMKWYLNNYIFEKCNKLTMQQFASIKEMGIIPDDLTLAVKMVNFKKYVLDDTHLVEKYIDPNKKPVKRGYHEGRYTLDQNSTQFFIDNFTEDSVRYVRNGFYVVGEKSFTKEADSYIQPLKDWFSSDKALEAYNKKSFEILWDKHAGSTPEAWSMKALNYYDGKHELENINESKYGIENFFELSETPEVYDTYSKYINNELKTFPKYKITRIAGTVINADNNHYMIHLLTKYGVVPVKFNKGHYAYYGKQISAQLDPNSSKKTVLEKSWLQRGTKLIITGIRIEQNFKPMRYNDTVYQHTCNKIEEVYDNGDMLVLSERVKTD